MDTIQSYLGWVDFIRLSCRFYKKKTFLIVLKTDCNGTKKYLIVSKTDFKFSKTDFKFAKTDFIVDKTNFIWLKIYSIVR